MLSFTTYFLLKSPTAMSRLRAEIDAVCGDAPVTLEHLGRMPYLIGTSSRRILCSTRVLTRRGVCSRDA